MTSPPTATPEKTPTPTPVLTPTPTSTPAPEPDAFPELVNGDFEQARDDGTPYGWHKFGGSFAVVSAPASGNDRALEFTSETSSTKWVYQSVAVEPGAYYGASALAFVAGSGVDATFLRLSFFASDDGSGSAIESFDSNAISSAGGAWAELTTGPIMAPIDAHSVRVRLMLRPASGANASVYFDDVALSPTDAPTPTPTSTPTATPTATAITSTATPTATPTPPPPAADTPAPTAAPDVEPAVFNRLTNGSFEVQRVDGSPYGWRKVGGEIAVSNGTVVDGSAALAFVSNTGSTKWAYQNVHVDPGAYYEAALFAMPQAHSGEVFLRISWYESDDGSGQAISSDDSPDMISGSMSAYQAISTGVVKAPSEARSAKVKLMLRPGGESPVVAYFDAVTFTSAQPPADENSALSESDSNGAPSTSGNQPAQVSLTEDDDAPPDVTPAVLAAARTPVRLANVTLPPAAPAAGEAASDGGMDFEDWAIALSIGIPAVFFVLLGAYEVNRLREG